MKKILFLLLLALPLLGNAQTWFKTNKYCLIEENGQETWYKCDARVLVDKERNVKIIEAEKTRTFRVVSDDYKEEVDNRGEQLFWKAVDEDVDRCVLYLIFPKERNSVLLRIRYINFDVMYIMQFDD